MPSFSHLHVHSEYSLLESSLRLKAMVAKAAEDKMPAVALTDNGNMFGAIEFYFAALDKGVKPIIGLDVYIAPGSRLSKGENKELAQKPNSRLVLLAQNLKGYQNLCQISSIGFQEGFYYKPRIDYEVLEKFNSDLIALSGGLRGEVAQSFINEGRDKALEKVKNLKRIFGDRFYLEVNRTGLPEWKQVEAFIVEASEICEVPVVAANDVHYLERDDQIIQEVLICIGSNKTLSDESRYKLGSDQFSFKTTAQMTDLFKDRPEWLARTDEIIERCNIKFKLKDDKGKMIYHLPSYPTVNGRDLKEEIRIMSEKGLAERFKEAEQRGERILESEHSKYYERLAFELSVIEKMGFNGYFLIVQDFINWAKTNDIPVGPGRGSGAGSIVAFALKITDLDPMPYSLLFERFLNPDRISMPDFDIDFCQDRRQEVIRYVTQKYGQKSVSQIITYGKLQARAAIKDVGRVLGMSFAEVDVVTKLVPEQPGTTIDKALEVEPRLRELMEMNPQIDSLIGLAKRVEGMVRHAGIHAAGVVIADGELIQLAPLYKGADGENVVQYDMKHAEKIGLIKFDFLGLKTLTYINHAFKLILQNKGKKISTSDISLLDPGIYEIMSRGDTAGIFQFEGDGITDAIRKIKPNSFADITAINALYRPGPMKMIPDFADRKHGLKPVEYIVEDLKGILEETYGIIVYQEQVMGIASTFAGYSLGEADLLRRAMGKKDKELMDQQKAIFTDKASKLGRDPKVASELFDLILEFANYGFNKSHAAAYCVVAAQTAWLKNYYPAEFFAALLSTEISDTDKVVKYVKDAQKHNLKVLPPHINVSEYLFSVKGEDVYFGLGAIKGVGEAAIQSIFAARDQKPNKKFDSLSDFFESVDTRVVNKKVIECLIKAGAFDQFGYHRAQMLAGYQKFLDQAEHKRKDKELGQVSLFDLSSADSTEVKLDAVKQWTRTGSLAYEKEVLGFYLSDHPLKGFEKLMKVWASSLLCDLPKVYEEYLSQKPVQAQKPKYDPKNKNAGKKQIKVVGIISEIREIITKKGTRMAFAKMEDLSGDCELIVFPDAFAENETVLKDDRALFITGFLEVEEGNSKIIVESIQLFEDVIKTTREVTLMLHKIDESDYEKIHSILTEFPGNTPIKMEIFIEDFKKNVSVESDTIKKINVSQELLEMIHQNFGRTDFLEVNS